MKIGSTKETITLNIFIGLPMVGKGKIQYYPSLVTMGLLKEMRTS
jgi:hypothetical protein